MATISATPPHSPQIGGDSFDEIDIGAMPPPIPRRNGKSSISNQPAFYSLTHGFSIDEEDDGEMIDNEGKQKPKKESMELPSAESIGETNDVEKGKENDDNLSANHTNSSPPPSPYPLSAINLLPTDICDDGKCGGEEKEEDMANGKVPIELADHHPQPPSPPHTATTNQQQSPPPIYSTVYPPGIYPAPCYAAPQQNGIQSHQNVHQQQQHNVPAAYIIDSSVLNGMPAVLIRQGPNGQCAEHTMSGPVLIFSDPYAELARRRRALAIITFTLLFFPTVFFLLLLYSLSYNY